MDQAFDVLNPGDAVDLLQCLVDLFGRVTGDLRDQIDPTIASISTIMVIVSSSLLVMAQVFGKSKDGSS